MTGTSISPDRETLSLEARRPGGPIVVATDGSTASEAAFRVARTLRDRTGLEIRVVSVVEPTANVVPAPLVLANPLDGSRVSERHALVRAQIERCLGTDPVPLTIHVGWPPEMLAEYARTCDASFFVAGLVHHGRLARMARMETPLAVLRGAGTPVLAIPASLTRDAERVVVAVDLTDTSVVAVERAAPLLRQAKFVHLVHVQDFSPPLAEPQLLPIDDTESIKEVFRRVRERIEVPADARIQEHILTGSPAIDIADFVASMGAQLVVLGHQHRGLWGRMLHSSVAERVYRLASCAVFIAPDQWHEDRQLPRPGFGVRTDVFKSREAWVNELRAFTTRNIGRRLNLEIMTPELGAQAAVVNFPLLGIDFDDAASSVDIMLGDERRGARHLSHTVHDVTALDLSRYETGADWSLRIAHPGGQTLLTFVK